MFRVIRCFGEEIFNYGAKRRERVAQAALDRSRDLLRLNQTLIEGGRMAAMDIVQTEADVANQELALERSQTATDSARRALALALALDPQTVIVPGDSLSVHPQPVSLDRALALARENNPDYLAQVIAVSEAGLALGTARNERLWDVSLVGSLSASAASTPAGAPSTGVEKEGTLGLRLSAPLNDSTTKRNVVAARVAVDSAKLTLEEVRERLDSATRGAVKQVDTQWRQYQLTDRALDLARRKVDIEKEKLSLGRSSNFQVLSYETDLKLAEGEQIDAMIGYLNALTDLDETVGQTLDTWHITLTP